MEQLIAGSVVTVRCYGGEILTRRVVRDAKRSIVVCTEGEYEDAVKEGRKPDGVGFPRSAVSIAPNPPSVHIGFACSTDYPVP
jgi:hypothetical protein